MNIPVIKKAYPAPPFDRKEILRYAGCARPDPSTDDLLDRCLSEIGDRCVLQVCFAALPLTLTGALCDFGAFSVQSAHLSKNLAGCETVILFAATAGTAPDRLIGRYSRIAPAKALLFQAIGAERIEALCDIFCEEIAAARGIRPKSRFSPGYGDLPLTVQKDIFAVLNPTKQIGVALNDTLTMSPSKSVTAFLGIPAQNP